MADSLESSALVKYVMDLISAGGRIVLEEREANNEDIGRFARDVPHVVRIMRAGHVVNIDAADAIIQTGDKLITVRPATAANSASNQL